MSSVSELDMEFTFEGYFRQVWTDTRLAFENGPSKLILNIKMLEKVWMPNTYFINSNYAYVNLIF